MDNSLSNRDPKPPRWMVVLETYNLPEAHIVAGRLQAEDIHALVHTVAGAGAMGIHIGTIGEVKVLVTESDYGRALEILYPEEAAALPPDEQFSDNHDEEDDDEYDTDTNPRLQGGPRD